MLGLVRRSGSAAIGQRWKEKRPMLLDRRKIEPHTKEHIYDLSQRKMSKLLLLLLLLLLYTFLFNGLKA
jgi:hypothetical protein